jgi:hypothetical protein
MHSSGLTTKRRDLYQITLGENNQVEVAVWTDSGDSLVGKVVDVSAQGVALRVPRNTTPVLSLGESVAFPFTPRTRTDPVALTATVRSRNRMGKHWHYGFEFRRNNTLNVRVAEEFYALFNRRHAFRVKPLPEEPVPVTIASPGASIAPIATAQLFDVSATGLGVLVSLSKDPSLADDDVLRTTLCPPTSSCPLKLTGRIRHRTQRASAVRYGMEFDPDHSEQFERDHENLVDYIIHRQLQDLGNDPGPSSPRPPLPLRKSTILDPSADQVQSA